MPCGLVSTAGRGFTLLPMVCLNARRLRKYLAHCLNHCQADRRETETKKAEACRVGARAYGHHQPGGCSHLGEGGYALPRAFARRCRTQPRSTAGTYRGVTVAFAGYALPISTTSSERQLFLRTSYRRPIARHAVPSSAAGPKSDPVAVGWLGRRGGSTSCADPMRSPDSPR